MSSELQGYKNGNPHSCVRLQLNIPLSGVTETSLLFSLRRYPQIEAYSGNISINSWQISKAVRFIRSKAAN